MLRFLLLITSIFLDPNLSEALDIKSLKQKSKKQCNREFIKPNFTYGFKFILGLYYTYPCHPLETLSSIKANDRSWTFAEFARLPIRKKLQQNEQLEILKLIRPQLTQSSDVEKNLLKQIKLKKKLKIDFSQERATLFQKFPSHQAPRKANLSPQYAKDLRRRGLNRKAIRVYRELLKSSKGQARLEIYKNLVRTQKNIARDKNYLYFSKIYTKQLWKQYRRNPSNKNRKKLLEQALLDVRRIWTYSSTKLAFEKLNTLIKSLCKSSRECGEHYWIKGRILEELKDFNSASYWYTRAVESTPLRDSEFQHRLWNLAWLSKKHFGKNEAFNILKQYTTKLPKREVHSRLYFWMSQWSSDQKDFYIQKIEKYHPLSFYLWSALALNKPMSLSKKLVKPLKRAVRFEEEKNLLLLIDLEENSLARAYAKRSQRRKKILRKRLTWKRLKAKTGLYADLLAELESGRISPESNIPFFFSRAFEQPISTNAKKFNVDKELIWSIIRQESNFDSYARSWADAFGLMQILPERATDYLSSQALPQPKLNPFLLYDPRLNIEIGTWLLNKNNREFKGQLPLSIAAYNASRSKVKEWKRRFLKDENWLEFIEEVTYRETRKYIKLVSRNLAVYQAMDKAGIDH